MTKCPLTFLKHSFKKASGVRLSVFVWLVVFLSFCLFSSGCQVLALSRSSSLSLGKSSTLNIISVHRILRVLLLLLLLLLLRHKFPPQLVGDTEYQPFSQPPYSWATCHFPPANCHLPTVTCQMPPANFQGEKFR